VFVSVAYVPVMFCVDKGDEIGWLPVKKSYQMSSRFTLLEILGLKMPEGLTGKSEKVEVLLLKKRPSSVSYSFSEYVQAG
jgi:hypothetical protein